LAANGFQAESAVEPFSGFGEPDFVGKKEETGELIVAEFKLFLSKRARSALFYQAISQLQRYRQRYPSARVLLIISVPLPEAWKNTALHGGVNEIWDLPVLIQKATINPELTFDLFATLTDAGVADLGTLGTSTNSVDIETPLNFTVDEGRKGWKDFENQCKEALIFLFGDQFGDWSEQSQTEDELHRRDFIARLRPTRDFWTALAHDFHSRYIVFEFKNYVDKISQDQVYSTEKYLFTTALRSIAVIVARNGADLAAFKAAAGALREAGKLILIISLDDLCSMLHSQDRGDDPEVFMYARLDELLTKLGR
jgi:hypothetical protein